MTKKRMPPKCLMGSTHPITTRVAGRVPFVVGGGELNLCPHDLRPVLHQGQEAASRAMISRLPVS
jgi:hypothetical protein